MIDSPTKLCTKCGETKDISSFNKDSQKKDGLYSSCKDCVCKNGRAHYKRHQKEDPKYYTDRNVRFRSSLTEEDRKATYRKAYESSQARGYVKKWCDANKDKRSDSARRYVERHPERVKARMDRYQKSNPEVISFHQIKRRKAMTNCTPKWLTKEDKLQIRLIYMKRRFISEVTGIPHDVDHVHPLTHKDLCGLHVPWNMQILPSIDNRRKHNKLIEL